MLLATCRSGYNLIIEHNHTNVGLWEVEFATKGDYLFEVPEECITNKEEDKEEYITYTVDATLGQISYIGRKDYEPR